jgi:hypothetical protein
MCATRYCATSPYVPRRGRSAGGRDRDRRCCRAPRFRVAPVAPLQGRSPLSSAFSSLPSLIHASGGLSRRLLDRACPFYLSQPYSTGGSSPLRHHKGAVFSVASRLLTVNPVNRFLVRGTECLPRWIPACAGVTREGTHMLGMPGMHRALRGEIIGSLTPRGWREGG